MRNAAAGASESAAAGYIDRIASTRSELAAAEKLSGQARKDALTKLSQQLHTDAQSAGDQPKAHKLASAVGDLAK